ncbi:MAG TPA: zinc-ribbon domain-containing protein [Desulfomonilaceae bacterium]|nr:zinc-ribbon domain-containing protein [Desulfomonilaceae bacterium]
MIVTCPRCNGKMRVDESRLPSGERVKVRCPHCKEISAIEATVQSVQTGSPVDRSVEPAAKPESSAADTSSAAVDSRPSAQGSDRDLYFPKDAFHNFRFPAETETPQASNEKPGSPVRTIVWIAVSVAIIGLFALLVNLVLPGPLGQEPLGGRIRKEQVAPKLPGAQENPATPPASGARK